MKNHGELRRRPAIIAGVSLLIMTFAAFFSYGYAHSSLVVNGDAIVTFNNLQASLSLFYLEIAGWVVIILADLLVSWAFFKVLQPIHATFALWAGGLRLVYTFILGIAVLRLGMVSSIVQNFSVLNENAAIQTLNHIQVFESIWSLGLIIFGLHLIMVGVVALKAIFIPKWISLLVMVAGASYLTIHLLYNLFPAYESATATIEAFLIAPMMVGELGFGIWLLIRGVKKKTRAQQSFEGAS
ncbi:DUF4386 domain-containing protein [Salimicrobium sp. PL1-032A]|uniref:DUF4386 domain-containing protein n=1 Tax=Salimicrobium sp. PL1-032A TaxID=3095364 RepID=UPI003261D44F